MNCTLTDIYRYPVKSLQGERLESSLLTTGGIAGDRQWAVCLAETGKAVSAKQAPGLMTLSARFTAEPKDDHLPGVEITVPGEAPIFSDAADCDGRLSRLMGIAVKLLPASNGAFFDDAPIHILSHQSLGALRNHTRLAHGEDIDFDPRRFRANLIVDIDDASLPFPEQSWAFKALRCGEVSLQMASGTERCAMTTFAFDHLPAEPRILKGIMESTRGVVGMYSRTTTSGTIRCGDRLDFI